MHWKQIGISLAATTVVVLAMRKLYSRPTERADIDKKMVALEQKLAHQADELAVLANRPTPATVAYPSPAYEMPPQASPSATLTPKADDAQLAAERERQRQAYLDHLEFLVHSGSKTPAGRAATREVQSVLANVTPSVRAQVECEAALCKLQLAFSDLTRNELIGKLFLGPEAAIKSAGTVASASEDKNGERRLVVYIARGGEPLPQE